MMERYERAQVDFANLPPQEQSSHMGDISGQCIRWMTEYMYEARCFLSSALLRRGDKI